MDITEIFITGIIFLSIYKILELFVRRKERLTLIDKLTELPPDTLVKNIPGLQNLQEIPSGGGDSKFSALKWGLFAIGVGAGCVIATVMNLNSSNYMDVKTYTGGCILLCGGVGLLIAFVVEYCLRKNADK